MPQRKPGMPAETATMQAFEHAVATLAPRQHGVVTRGQLLAAGVRGGQVDRRLEAGRLRAIHRGVYVTGPVVAPRAREMAACLACGPSAVVSHASAAALWRLLPATTSAPVDITIRQGYHKRPGIRIHRVRLLRSDETTTLDGIPLTTAARTLYDLAGSVDGRALERALAEALALRLTTLPKVREVLKRHRGRRGARSLAAVIGSGRSALTRSEAERRFLDLVREAKLDEPEVNVSVAGYEVDVVWRTERLVVEIDGRAFHASPAAFERDRLRDAALAAAGYRVVRVTWRQMETEPAASLVRVAQALAHGARA